MEKSDIKLVSHEEVLSLINEKQAKIDELRLNGVTKIENLKNENVNIKKNKQLDNETKTKIISKNKELLKEANEVKVNNKNELKVLVKELISFINANYKVYIDAKKEENKVKFNEFKADYNNKLAERTEKFNKELEEENATFASKEQTKEAKNEHALKVKDIKLAFESDKNDLKVKFNDLKNKEKDALHYLELEKFNAIEKANNKKLPVLEAQKSKWENYKYNFNLSKFFLNNGLYITIVVLLIAAVIFYAIKNGRFLFNLNTILLILNQVSPKIFLALGVAGLILLAGTDLSVGRLVGLAAVFTGMLVTSDGKTSVTFFGVSPDFSAIPLGLRVVFAFLLSVVACVVITSIAGFFTAKFKMHPFISTLATQLITFGVLAGVTGNSFTGSPDPTVKQVVAGTIGNFPIMLIWAAIAIIIVWFIWNKTTFGKNMYAVGGNPEAASVSGINVFAVTMGVFIMAGVLYGLGGSIYGIYTGNVRAQTGQGMESDAIAACVVGGVSFTGGIGKISGVVIGALLFQVISVVLPYIGITDANYQLAIKGLIVLVAVALDCAKYLKKK